MGAGWAKRSSGLALWLRALRRLEPLVASNVRAGDRLTAVPLTATQVVACNTVVGSIEAGGICSVLLSGPRGSPGGRLDSPGSCGYCAATSDA